jgi:transcriptional regulator with XRE-family HTH domain
LSNVTLRIRELREAKGLTQQELADRARIRPATLSAMENGHTKGVDFATLDRIAQGARGRTWFPGSPTPVTITRRQAVRIARDHLHRESIPWTVADLGSVRDLGELSRDDLRAPGLLLPSPDFTGCWIVYCNDGRPLGIRASVIVAVSKRDGSVVYAGGAMDEG